MNEFLQELQEILQLQVKLEAKLRKLEALVSSNKATKKQRQAYKSIKGQLKSVIAQQKNLKTSVAKLRISTKKVSEPKAPKVKTIPVIKPKLTRAQVFAMYRKSNTDRFIQRILLYYPELEDKLSIIYYHMDGASDEEVYIMIKRYGLNSTWFDSDGSWDQTELVGWNSNSLLHAIRGIGPLDDSQRAF